MLYKHFTRDDRIKLGVLLRAGHSIRSCAKHTGYSHTAIGDEVNGNCGRNNYDPYLAHRKAKNKRHQANQCHRKFRKDSWQVQIVIGLLKDGWSPEQVAGRTKRELSCQLFSPATIYNNVNPDKELSNLLPRKHNKYRRTKGCNERKLFRESIDDRRCIDTRPAVVTERIRIGDWEGDTIIGKERTARIVTHVERKTGYLLAELLPNVSAEIVSDASTRAFKAIPRDKKYTITYDRGTEFSDYEITEKKTKIEIYFANAYHSWERGTNENTNGLLRRYFPKRTLFSNISKSKFKNVVLSINQRPRKRLGYQSPYELFWGVKLRTIM
jgi:IS30 family transposase